ncbi:DUF1934 domain-containing protein [Alkalihalobacterium elongatum]|uniref:DUF1934 domain-containing protein n=1 Tax=Alkalihalobacterium elongatum TaxID=2675466 RepID=UPI001C1FC2A8|nr:DUF1934 family protein [Alkalihalobacterium elongatum]
MSVKEKRPITVQMETTIRQGGEKERLSLNGKGNIYVKKGYTYLLFKEVHNDKVNVQTTVKIGENEVTIIRQGDLSMRQTYTVGEKTEGIYRSPFGYWQTTAKTHVCHYNWPANKTKGKLQLKYDYFLQGEPSGTFDVTITIEEENE